MENEWKYAAGYTYAGQFFAVWVKAVKLETGLFKMESKVDEVGGPEALKRLAEEHGFEYFSSYE